MNLVLLGQTDRGLVVALQDAFSDTRRSPRDIVWGWDHPHVQPRPEFNNNDLLMVLAQSESAQDWRDHLLQRQLGFVVAQGQGRELIENIRFAWGRHARSQADTRSEIRPRYISACENCVDPECEHRLFRLSKREL
ncbi:MAG: hypothetical protein QM527_11710 [Alphaproteobacteria bacterium]|nr:hypothetical protein [Alphaproteobacteria bacterium]